MAWLTEPVTWSRTDDRGRREVSRSGTRCGPREPAPGRYVDVADRRWCGSTVSLASSITDTGVHQARRNCAARTTSGWDAGTPRQPVTGRKITRWHGTTPGDMPSTRSRTDGWPVRSAPASTGPRAAHHVEHRTTVPAGLATALAIGAVTASHGSRALAVACQSSRLTHPVHTACTDARLPHGGRSPPTGVGWRWRVVSIEHRYRSSLPIGYVRAGVGGRKSTAYPPQGAADRDGAGHHVTGRTPTQAPR